MTELQIASLLLLLHQTPTFQRAGVLQKELQHFGLTKDEMALESANILQAFQHGVGKLNTLQLQNLLSLVAENGIHEGSLLKKLAFYEVAQQNQNPIVTFIKQYYQAGVSIDAVDLDAEFRGIQVASRDNFNTIIEQGWTGDWDFQPANLRTQRVQVASMNETGPFPRGYYLNADITDIQPIVNDNGVRYRIFIANPQIINSGNRNVRFIANPISYK